MSTTNNTMTSPSLTIKKTEKKTPRSINFSIKQVRTASCDITYDAFVEDYMEFYNGIETKEEFEERCERVWKKVIKSLSHDDWHELEEADEEIDDLEDECTAGSECHIQEIVEHYNNKCPTIKKYEELISQKMKEAKEIEQKIKELTAQLTTINAFINTIL